MRVINTEELRSLENLMMLHRNSVDCMLRNIGLDFNQKSLHSILCADKTYKALKHKFNNLLKIWKEQN